MLEFRSAFAPLLRSFIQYSELSDRWNKSSYEVQLRLFDRFCANSYPEAKELTQEMVDTWCMKRASENNNSCRSRIYVVVSFVRYLNRRGLTTVSVPEIPREEKKTYIPHAFTMAELERFFNECDRIVPYAKSPRHLSRKLTIPVFFRLLYSSGIRTTEARLLRKANVDLSNGVLDIQYSKGYDQHYIVLHDSMLELMRTYDQKIQKIYPDRVYFFPESKGGFHTAVWVQKNFRKLWDAVNYAYATPYELRHHYATENINNCVGEGFGFDDKLLYLSKSMGHGTLASTKYYYSLVPSMSDILEEKTQEGFDALIPEVDYEDWK